MILIESHRLGDITAKPPSSSSQAHRNAVEHHSSAQQSRCTSRKASLSYKLAEGNLAS